MKHCLPRPWRIGPLLLLPLIMSATAQPFKGVGDPTRPPAGAMRPQAGSGGPGAAASAASAASMPASAASAPEPRLPLQLDAIRFDAARGASVALINGELVRVGERVQALTVESISREDVVLRGASGIRRLTLRIESEPPSPVSARAAARGRKEKK